MKIEWNSIDKTKEGGIEERKTPKYIAFMNFFLCISVVFIEARDR